MIDSIESIFPGSTAASTGSNKSELGQEDFLKLLVAQLENQDPSNPADNGQFMSQIAQFSMVSGIDELGASFDGVASNLYASQAMQAAELVGKHVLADSPIVSLTEGEAIEGAITLNTDANAVRVHVYDLSGQLVNTVALGDGLAGLKEFIWDGSNQDGEFMEDGLFTMKAEGLMDGQLQGLPVQFYTRVDSVSVDRANNSVSLNLDNNRSISMSEIEQFK